MGKTFKHDLMTVCGFPLVEGMHGPADAGEQGLVLAYHGRRFCQAARAAQHGAHCLTAETLQHGLGKPLQLGTERRVRRRPAP